jgi:PAS domain S-box-containing protein
MKISGLNRYLRRKVSKLSRRLLFLIFNKNVNSLTIKHNEKILNPSSTESINKPFHSKGEIYYRADTKGSLIAVSPGIEDLLGYKPEELEGIDIADKLYKYPDQRLELFQILQEKGKVDDFNVTLLHKNGSSIKIRSNSYFIYDKSGKPIGIEGIITERKKRPESASEQKVQREKKRKTLTDQLPVGIYRTTPEGRFIYFNQTLAEMLGYEPNELYSVKVPVLYVDYKERENEINELLNYGENILQKELTLERKDGQHIIVKDRLNALKDHKGNIIYIDGVLENITEKKKIEKALKESESKFRSLAQTTSTAIMVYQGNKWVYANPAAEKISGYKLEELKQMNYWEFVAPEHQNMIKSRGEKRQNYQDTPSGYEFRIIDKEGKEKWVYLEGSVMEFQGKPAGLISVIDITHLKNTEKELREKNQELQTAEEELRAANNALKETNAKLEEQTEELKNAKEKAEESDRLKSAFLANMSHEIRTPINGIVGFTQLLREEEYSDEEKKEFYEIIDNNSKQLLQIINDIIDISMIEANQLSIKKETFSLNKLMDELNETIQHELEKVNKNNITLELYKSMNDENDFIETDKTRLRQVISNLLNNAVKYTKKGTIKFGYHLLDKTKLQVFVEDTGIGIAREKQAIIFDQFRRSNELKSDESGGTGLGLSISKKLIELLNGTIDVESTPEKGSNFTFTLPIKRKPCQVNSKEANTKNKYNWTDKYLLVVEDDHTCQQYIKEILKPTGINITICEKGMDGLKQIRETNHFSIVLMDIKLPDMNGLQVTREIRKINKDIPIVATTAYAMHEDKTEAIEAGCNDYIAKPVDHKELLELIKSNIS